MLSQIPLVLAAIAVYFGVRHLTEGGAEVAKGNAELIIDLQARLGISIEREFQEWALGFPGMLRLMNTIYVWGHWPIIAAVLGSLAWQKPEKFILYRNTMMISGLMGMIIVATFPVAPPRLLDIGLLDTVTMHTEAYRVLQPPAFTNQYAAMPSFHFGWNLLMGIVLVREASALWVRMFGRSVPVLMLLSIVITGNHFILDAVVGGAIVLVVLSGAIWYQRRVSTGYYVEQQTA